MNRIERPARPRLPAVLAAAAGLVLTACGPSAQAAAGPVTLRIGFLANITHATAIAGLQQGIFAADAGTRVTVKAQSFKAGPDEVQAIFGHALDAAFMGPNPAINAWAQSHGSAIRIVSGATVGGAALVVRPGAHITTPADLRGKTIATPQLGNTQDVALRAYLKAHGMSTTPQGGGDVKIAPTDNSTTLALFKAGQIDGAWVPEPWATRLVDEAGGKVFVDEASLWPGGRFVTTVLVVTSDFLRAHPDVVKNLVRGLVDATDWVAANPAQAQQVVNDQIAKITLKALRAQVIVDSWSHLTFTVDPVASALAKAASDAESVGLLKPVDLRGIYDLVPLNQVLAAKGRAAVSDGGLGGR